MVVGFTFRYRIRILEPPTWGRSFSPGTPVSSTNETDRHDKTEILLKVALNTITPNPIIQSGTIC